MGAFYILVLDKNLPGQEGIWYVTASSADLNSLTILESHDDTIVMQLFKAFYPGVVVSTVSLTNNHNNVAEAGTIYEVHHI